MAVPFGYGNYSDYFGDALRFFTTYKWIYQSPNTHILVDKVFDQFPSDWLPFLRNLKDDELKNLDATVKTKENSPKSLVGFFEQLERLKPTIVRKERGSLGKSPKNCRVGQKKYHEILALGPLVHEICENVGSKCVMDIGSGLGYLSNLLHENYDYQVLGVEGSAEKVKAAENLKSPSNKKVKFVHHYITKDSEQTLKSLNEGAAMESTCIAGLHACADLSVTILDLFLNLPFAKALVMMPCCYHRLRVDKDGNFENFPASTLLKNLFDDFQARDFLKVPFLRLACQKTCFDLSDEEANRCLYRSILQDAAESGNCRVRRLKRKSGKDAKDFDDYLSNLTSTHELVGDLTVGSARFRDVMREKWAAHKGDSKSMKALSLFQGAIQGVCENFVLLDRVALLQEKGVRSHVEKVTDQRLSPRCYALVATRP